MKAVSGDEKDFFLKELGVKEVIFARWMTKLKKDNRSKTEERLIVVGGSRLLSIKRKLGSKSVRRDGHLFQLVSMSSPNAGDVVLRFKDFAIEVVGDDVDELVRSVRFAYEKITFDWPDRVRYQLDVPDAQLLPIEMPVPPLSGYEDCYVAYCRYYRIAINPFVIEYVRELSTQEGSYELNLSRVKNINIKDGDKHVDMRPLSGALRCNTHFTAVRLTGVPSQKMAIAHLADALATNTVVTALTVSALETQHGFDALGKAFITNPSSSLTELDLSGNQIKESAMNSMMEGLVNVRVRFLDLSRCDLSPKCVATFCQGLRGNPVLSNSLVALNLSFNKIGPQGSHAIGEWLAGHQMGEPSLITLLLGTSGLQMAPLVAGLERQGTPLAILDVSGNKILAPECVSFARMLNETISITDLDLHSCRVAHGGLNKIIESFTNNNKVPATLINASGIDLEGVGITTISPSLQMANNLHTFSVDDSNLKPQGVLTLLQALENCTSLKRLQISRTFKPKQKNAQQALLKLGDFVNHSRARLEALRIAGGEKDAVGRMLLPVLEAVRDNTSLTELDITGQQCGDQGLTILTQTVAKNKTLKTLLIDGNGFSMQGFQTFLVGLETNHTLTALSYPARDLPGILAYIKANKAQSAQLKNQLQYTLKKMSDVVKINKKGGLGNAVVTGDAAAPKDELGNPLPLGNMSAPGPPSGMPFGGSFHGAPSAPATALKPGAGSFHAGVTTAVQGGPPPPPFTADSAFDAAPPPPPPAAYGDDDVFDIAPPPMEDWAYTGDEEVSREANRMTMDVSKLADAVGGIYALVSGDGAAAKAEGVNNARATIDLTSLNSAVDELYSD